MIGALGGSLLRGAGGALAKGAGKKLIGGRNKKQNQIVKRPNQGQEQSGSGALVVRPKTALIPASDIPARRTTVQPKTTAGVSGKSTLEKIDKEVLEIRKLLGKSIKEEKKDVKNKKKLFEKERRQRTEKRLESKPGVGSGIGAGLKKLAPGGGIVDAIQNFIFSVIAGKILIFLFENRETVFNIIKGLAAATEFIIDLGGKILDGIIGLVDGVYNVTDAIGKEIESVGGEQAGKEYNKFLGTFNKFINLAMILAMAGVPGNIGGGKIPGGGKVPKTLKLPGGKPIQTSKFAGFNQQSGKFGTGTNKSAEYMKRGRQAKLIERKYGNNAARAYQNSYDNAVKSGKSPTQAAQKAKANINKLFKKGQIVPQAAGKGLGATGGSRATGRMGGVFRRGLGRAGSRLQTRIMGRGARLATRRFGAAASKFASKIKIPIIGPLIMGINTYMETGRLDRALFSAGGAAIGGLLGNLIPIPILGSIIGTFAGEYIGDIFFELIRGGGISAVGEKLQRDIQKVLDGVKIVRDWIWKGVTNIGTMKGPKIPDKITAGPFSVTIPFIPKGGLNLGGWADLLNPIGNPLIKFDILRKAFFSESKNERGDVVKSKVTESQSPRGFNDQDDPNSPGGNRPRSITGGSGRRSLPSGSGNITKVPFDDPNFNPGTTRKKDTMIYLHWTAGNYGDASASYGYHTIFTGDGGIVRNKSYDARGGHTEGKNSNSVGLSLAAMAGATGVHNFGSQPVTHEQLNQMAAEAARLAVRWGWSEGDIDKNVWTHAEAGSGLDPRGLSGHLDMNGDGKPDNYGMFNRAPNEPMHRWDLYTVTEGGEPGSGGPILRDMIKKHYKNFKAELSGKEPPVGDDQNDKRGDSDQDDPNKSGPKPQPPSKNKIEPYTPSNDTSMENFDPAKYTEGSLNSYRLVMDDKSYYIRYKMEGNDAIIKQINKRISGGVFKTEELGSVDPRSDEFKKIIESKQFRDDVAKQTNLELKKVRVDKDIEKYYLYDKSYQQNYKYWMDKYMKDDARNLPFDKIKQMAAAAAKEGALLDMKDGKIDKSGQTTINTDITDDVRDKLYQDTKPTPPIADAPNKGSGHGLDFSSLKGTGAYTDIFAGARAHAATSAGQRSVFYSKPSNTVSSSSILPVNLNSSDGLREQTDYETDGSTTVVVNRPYIINNNVYEGQNTPTSGRKYYT
jgi:hypothetical protein